MRPKPFLAITLLCNFSDFFIHRQITFDLFFEKLTLRLSRLPNYPSSTKEAKLLGYSAFRSTL